VSRRPTAWVLTSLGLALCSPLVRNCRAGDTVVLQERFQTGYQYHVSTRVELTGTLSVPTEKDHPPKPLPLTGSSAVEYDERILGLQTGGGVSKTARIYRRVDFQRKVGDQPQQSTIRPDVRRLAVLRLNQTEVPFSPDGPLTWNELDLVRTDVFTAALTGLFPGKPVRPGDRWAAEDGAVQELTDLKRLDQGKVECRLDQLTVMEKRRHARVAFSGTVRGINEDGPNRQQLEGYFLFDLESNHLSYLYLHGLSFLLDKDGKTVGQVEGRFVLTRQANTSCRELESESWKGAASEPTAENTLLLYENRDQGLRFLFPRRWRVTWSRGPQVALDEPNGSGLLITVESLKRTPTALQFQGEVRTWLQQQKFKELRVDAPKRLAANASSLDEFAIDAEVTGQRVLLDYYIVTNPPLGGATLAARVMPADLATLRSELERIARSVTITRPIVADPKP
jgi:hypothetical protein